MVGTMTQSIRYSLFDTPLGLMAIAWTDRGLCGIRLPEKDERATAAAFESDGARSDPGDLPPWVRAAQRDLVEHLSGRSRDLSSIPLDLEGLPPFHRKVYEVARAIPAGSCVTYGDLARRVGSPHAARAVGQALSRNPFPVVVPCHRVVASGGGAGRFLAGGFSAYGGLSTKARLLEVEGVVLVGAHGRAPLRGRPARRAVGFAPRGWRRVRALRRSRPPRPYRSRRR
jgi:methylated-DNA-[protein]-cysteine S-methyltransferase